mgnify:CR=1 FL=1
MVFRCYNTPPGWRRKTGCGLLNELATTVALPVQTLSLVTTRRFADVEECVQQRHIDLIIAGHHNRLLGVLSSHSLEYINHLTVDVLIKHLP